MADTTGNNFPTREPHANSITTPPLISIIQPSDVQNDAGVSSFSNKEATAPHARHDQDSGGGSPFKSVLCALLVSCGAVASIVTSAFLCNASCKAQRHKDLDP